jgi:YNFM family putative membrane transporter
VSEAGAVGLVEAVPGAESPPTEVPHIERGTAAFHRTNLAVFAAGFSTFALLYCVQPLLPEFSREFGVGAAQSSLAVSLTTATLAVSMLAIGSVSEAVGRKPVMVASLFAAALLTVVSALVPGWRSFLALRAVEGIAFAGLPAIAMAYLSEEMGRGSIGLAMGLYVGGTGLGGMAGRLLTAAITDLVSWRAAVGTIGVLGLIAAVIFWRSLPPSRHFHPRPLAVGALAGSFVGHLTDPGLVALFSEGFLVMGSFVTIYNYIGYRLLAPPYSLSQTAVGAIFIVYLVGIGSSAWLGDLSGRIGRGKLLWVTIAVMLAGVAATFARPVPTIVAGIALLTFGFFAAHSIVSSWVGLRAHRARAQASSLYLFFYYTGSAVAGSVGGFFWSAHGWRGVATFVSVLLGLALAVSLWLARLQPRPHPVAP